MLYLSWDQMILLLGLPCPLSILLVLWRLCIPLSSWHFHDPEGFLTCTWALGGSFACLCLLCFPFVLVSQPWALLVLKVTKFLYIPFSLYGSSSTVTFEQASLQIQKDTSPLNQPEHVPNSGNGFVWSPGDPWEMTTPLSISALILPYS